MLFEPNTFAYVALLSWIPLAAVVFGSLPAPVALCVVFFGGVTLLPERVAFDLEGLPPLDKQNITALAAVLGSLLFCRGRLASAGIGRGPEALLLALVAAGVGTALTNGDTLVYGPTVVPPIRPYDATSMVIRDLLRFGVPFVLGRAVFRSPRDLRVLCRALVVVGLLCSAFVLVELRLSPQWHIWIYGFHPHSFAQVHRFGGYRPVVFMQHGLALALFMGATAMMAASVTRARIPVLGLAPGLSLLWLSAVVALCKSLGVIVYSLLSVPAILVTPARAQVWMALAVCAVVLVYPVARMAGLFPTGSLTALAGAVSEERAASLQFRFEHEDGLAGRARERIWWGWGGFGRNEMRDERSGRSMSIPDGFWVHQLGTRGWIGWLVPFALLLYPGLRASRARRRLDRPDRLLVAGLCLVVAVYAIDLLPNGLFTNLPYLLAGALFGCASSPDPLPAR